MNSSPNWGYLFYEIKKAIQLYHMNNISYNMNKIIHNIVRHLASNITNLYTLVILCDISIKI